MPEPGIPDLPEWLLPTAREHWDHAINQTRHMGVLSMADRDMLALNALSMAEWRQAMVLVQRFGPLTAGRRGLVVNPACRIERDRALLARSVAAR